jgi:hypothetical protein
MLILADVMLNQLKNLSSAQYRHFFSIVVQLFSPAYVDFFKKIQFKALFPAISLE